MRIEFHFIYNFTQGLSTISGKLIINYSDLLVLLLPIQETLKSPYLWLSNCDDSLNKYFTSISHRGVMPECLHIENHIILSYTYLSCALMDCSFF